MRDCKNDFSIDSRICDGDDDEVLMHAGRLRPKAEDG